MTYADEALEHWRNGKTVEAGRLIFENLSQEVRVKWASKILALCVERTGLISPPIAHILEITRNPSLWGTAHDAFSAARHQVLKLLKLGNNRSDEQTLLLDLLGLAELVAKVTYNATDPDDEFDEDSGWWVPACVKSILDLLHDDRFSESMWFALCHQGDVKR